ncbi:MAG: hypothetical protein COT74_00280 [Bdellovibrionales bacterium CG10_big_fil_rev_8_21_14_0_10_45_34]|nr:MAG: hypothetical protein COT74_00280 [Bdellovibrionales bacterium CG10_big_fil_rev_8_21_14_0_10_45_34]
MRSAFVADKHNFGKSVQRFEQASGPWYRKPRSIFWEQLFFGNDSVLAPFFEKSGRNDSRTLSSYLFNLEIQRINDWEGISREIVSPEGIEIDDPHFYSFGVILAYSYIFGIRDLHKHNLVPTKGGLQVIDAEVALTNLLLPSETALLPYKDLSFERSGAQNIGSGLASFTADQKRRILAGYFDLFDIVFQNIDPLRSLLSEKINSTVPIRVILRNTKYYLAHLAGEISIEDLLLEERVQLERGDVPYFFKLIGERDLYWISSLAFDGVPVLSDLGGMRSEVERHARPISDLLISPTQLEQKVAQGTFLLARIFDLREPMTFGWNDKAIKIDQNSFKNEYTGSSFTLKK